MAYYKYPLVKYCVPPMLAVGLGISFTVHAETGLTPTSTALECTAEGMAAFFQLDGQKLAEARVNASGYGAPPKSFYPEPQRRLMAMRAAQVDAYRNLAERVNGMHIWGGTTIGDMVVEKDRYRVFLDSYLKGAKVMTSHPIEDGTFETVVELNLDQGFLRAALGLRPCPDQMSGAMSTSSRSSSAAPDKSPSPQAVSIAPTAPVMQPAAPAPAAESPVAKTIPLNSAPEADAPAKSAAAPAEGGKKSGKSSLYFSEDE
ncbi:MAG: LPP20 family lipoprotein [Gammaproteobacteria bacterium]|nr:LPP20 family lipoprotein [Gammaproteobacteria bacterium]